MVDAGAVVVGAVRGTTQHARDEEHAPRAEGLTRGKRADGPPHHAIFQYFKLKEKSTNTHERKSNATAWRYAVGTVTFV